MSKNVVIVGGGLAGLAASVYLARAGRTVTIFEKRRHLGGRAITHLRHGFRFNLGPHVFHKGGSGAQVLRELGIPVRGGTLKTKGVALVDGGRQTLPLSLWSLATTRLLSVGEKIELMKLRWRTRKPDAVADDAMSFGQWLDANVQQPRVRALLVAFAQLATYCAEPERQSALATLRQLRLTRRGGVYVDEGWQKLVDSLHGAAVASGVNFVTSSRIVSVDHEGGAVRSIELGGLDLEDDRSDTLSVAVPLPAPDGHGTKLKADAVILAIDPASARELIGDAATRDWPTLEPVTVACLDVALSKLPDPNATYAVGIDAPHHVAVHSLWAQLAPRGGALIHAAKYLRPDDTVDEGELERLLDALQPGWRDVVVHRRFLPSMTVTSALPLPGLTRPAATTAVKGLYLAGDWVGDEGILSDASLASGRAAAKAILAES